MHNGRLMVWNGTKLQEISDPLGSPALTTVYDDGMGVEYMTNMVDNASDSVIQKKWGCTLAIATAEGVYLVKNVIQQGQPTPFIYRIDRDNSGLDIGTPIATLPSGTVALDISLHLGSLIISVATSASVIMLNDISLYGHAQTVFYHYENDSLGTIGSPLGPAPDETVYKFIGVDVGNLYIGGMKRIWVYDAIRGGLHPLVNNDQSEPSGVWGSLVNVMLINNEENLQVVHDGDTVMRIPINRDEAGNNITHTLESVYFNGGLPAELKNIVAVTLMTDGLQSNETWTVTLSADDAAFGSALTFDTDGTKTVKKNLATPLSGYRFQYKLAYTASADVATPSIIKGIVIWMVQGEFVQSWRMKLRLADSYNIGNTVIRGETQQANIESLAANQAIVTFIDNYRTTSTTTKVRVQGAALDKESPKEGVIDVVLVEHPNT
jgi:hypothetical protein